jgi:hypothetical protein
VEWHDVTLSMSELQHVRELDARRPIWIPGPRIPHRDGPGSSRTRVPEHAACRRWKRHRSACLRVWGAATVASAAASGWIQRPPRTPTGGCQSRWEREAGRTLFSHRDARDASLRSFETRVDTPSPDPRSVQDHVSATAPRMDLSLAALHVRRNGASN